MKNQNKYRLLMEKYFEEAKQRIKNIHKTYEELVFNPDLSPQSIKELRERAYNHVYEKYDGLIHQKRRAKGNKKRELEIRLEALKSILLEL